MLGAVKLVIPLLTPDDVCRWVVYCFHGNAHPGNHHNPHAHPLTHMLSLAHTQLELVVLKIEISFNIVKRYVINKINVWLY